MARHPSQLLETGAAGAAGAAFTAAAGPMGRAASHMLERHGPGMQRQAHNLMERSKLDMAKATSSMAQALDRAASRAMSASQNFERAASKCLDNLDRSSTGRNSLDLAINQVLAGLTPPSTPSLPSPTKSSAAYRASRFHMQAIA